MAIFYSNTLLGVPEYIEFQWFTDRRTKYESYLFQTIDILEYEKSFKKIKIKTILRKNFKDLKISESGEITSERRDDKYYEQLFFDIISEKITYASITIGDKVFHLDNDILLKCEKSQPTICTFEFKILQTHSI